MQQKKYTTPRFNLAIGKVSLNEIVYTLNAAWSSLCLTLIHFFQESRAGLIPLFCPLPRADYKSSLCPPYFCLEVELGTEACKIRTHSSIRPSIVLSLRTRFCRDLTILFLLNSKVMRERCLQMSHRVAMSEMISSSENR